MTDKKSEIRSPRERFLATTMRLVWELDDDKEGALSRGDLAMLRREDGTRSPTFYKLAALVLHEELEPFRSEELLSEAERRWARVVHLMACTSGQHRAGASRFGAALANVELAESRLLRLLRAEGEAIDAAARAVLAPLVQKAAFFDPVDLAALILSAPHPKCSFHYEDGDQVRRRIARDFYRAESKSNESSIAS